MIKRSAGATGSSQLNLEMQEPEFSELSLKSGGQLIRDDSSSNFGALSSNAVRVGVSSTKPIGSNLL
jgi:hypothetical protein